MAISSSDVKNIVAGLKASSKGIKPDELKSLSTLADSIIGLASLDLKKATKSFSSLAGLKDVISGSSGALTEISAILKESGLGTIGRKPIEALKNLSDALNAFSSIDWKNTLRGFSYMAEIEKIAPQIENGLISIGVAVLNIADRKLIQAFENLSSLSIGLNAFSQIKWTNLIAGFTIMGQISRLAESAKIGFKAVAMALSDLAKKGAQKAFAGLESLATGFKTFSEIAWAKVVYGFTMMGEISRLAESAKIGFKAVSEALRPLANNEGIQAFKDLAEGFKTFSEIAWAKVVYGFTIMGRISRLAESAKIGFEAVSEALRPLANNEGIQAFKDLAEGFKTFSEIAWAKVVYGFTMMGTIVRLVASGKGFEAVSEALRPLANNEGIKAFTGLATGFKTFSEIKWLKIIIGLTAVNMFSKAFGGFAKAVDAMSTLSNPESKETVKTFSELASSLEAFAKVSWVSVLVGLKILQYTVKPAFEALASAGAILMANIELIGPAILALGAIGLALVPFGVAAMMAGAGVLMLGTGMLLMAVAVKKAVDPLTQLAKLDLFGAAAGIMAVSAALAAFALGQTGMAITGFFGKLLGGGKSPIDQLKEIADLGPNLEKTADALERIKEALAGMPSKSGMELGRLNEEGKEISVARAGAESNAGGAVDMSSTRRAVTNNLSSMVVNNGWMPDRSTALVLAPAI